MATTSLETLRKNKIFVGSIARMSAKELVTFHHLVQGFFDFDNFDLMWSMSYMNLTLSRFETGFR